MAGTSRLWNGLFRRVAIVSAIALAGGGLLIFEHVGTGAATGQPSQIRPNARPTTTTAHGTPSTPRHCTDGLGADTPQNKHCRPASGV
jgi:hypothetical protein